MSESSTDVRHAAVARELATRGRLPASVESYIDLLDAALADGFLANFELDQSHRLARRLRLDQAQVTHIHEGYFIALGVESWRDDQIDVVDEMRLTMAGAALAITTARQIELTLLAKTIETPVELSTFGLAPRDRVAFQRPLGTNSRRWARRVEALGLLVTDVAAARYVVTADPNHEDLAWLWQAGANIVVEWAFDNAVTELERRRTQRSWGLVLPAPEGDADQ